MKNSIWLLLFILIFVSCKKNDIISNEDSEIPINDSFDINNDNQYDFFINYFWFAYDDEGTTTGYITPLRKNFVLKRTIYDFLFLNENDTIRKDVNTNASWYDGSAHIIRKVGYYNNSNNVWTIHSVKKSDYLLGIKIIDNNVEIIGFINIVIDNITGKITVADKIFSEQDELIVKK